MALIDRIPPPLRERLTPVLQRLRHPSRRDTLRALAVLPSLLVLYVLVLIPFTPGISDLRKAKQEAPAVVLSADGKELAVFRRANRSWVKLPEVAPAVVDALIATEDRRFYEHGGLDWRRTGGAVLATLGGDRQGGSTLTQQLARNLYPDDIGRAPTLTRKIKEAITALKIEWVYTKDEILETYLNTVPFLYNAYGIEMAARTYFDKTADQLDVLEAATLVGMLKGTSYYNPVLNPERALQRRNLVLAQMDKAGKLPKGRLAALQKRPLKLDFERQTEPPGPAPHLTQQLRRWLIDWADRNNYSIHADGLVVRTGIDSRLQAAANQAVAQHMNHLQTLADSAWGPRAQWRGNPALVQALLRETPQYAAAREAGLDERQALARLMADTALVEALRRDKTRLQAGFVAIDPRSGQVRAWVGSRGFRDDQFDHVSQARRQPGSTFKPFVYGAAFEQGISPFETFFDGPVEIALGGGAVWRPSDSGEPTLAPMTLRDGLAFSKNTITAQLMQKVGPAAVGKLARDLGVRQSRLDLVPSLALGTSPVTLREMVSAYASIADGGRRREPLIVTRIEDRHGKVLEAFADPQPEPAMREAAAQTLVDALRGAIDRGTGAAIRGRWGISADVAGKTGTTQDNTDAWFILMHPQLVAGARVGFNDNRITMQDGWGQGARAALPIVGAFFQQALRVRAIDASARFAGLPPPAAAAPAASAPEGSASGVEAPAEPAAPAGPPPMPAAGEMSAVPEFTPGGSPSAPRAAPPPAPPAPVSPAAGGG
jgi:penicillin-binding protein 1A